ncbi:hypothetical protein ACLB2K_059385 [Fragaria x ananassa]
MRSISSLVPLSSAQIIKPQAKPPISPPLLLPISKPTPSSSFSAMMALRLRTNHRTLTNPSLTHHLFSTSSFSDPSDPTEPNPQSSSSSISNYLSDVKGSLRQQSHQSRPTPRINHPPPPARSSNAASLYEIRKNLSEFRIRSMGQNHIESNSSPPPLGSEQISFSELYKRKVSGDGKAVEFKSIRDSLKNIRPNVNVEDEKKGEPLSMRRFQGILRSKPSGQDAVGSGGLPRLFDKERIGEKREDGLKTEFIKIYSEEELGEKLRKLRPEGGGVFSFAELSERLVKLRKMDDIEARSRTGGVNFNDLRDSLVTLNEENKTSSIKRLPILELTQTPDYMTKPPKEGLVEKYFHPDNMSAAEKLKIELDKVRDEFKMSESDCGSSRVQVAQLTTKIKHLSSVLHKKDKHSLKGLQAMVQRRKKLLKYLRRTDWDSYCLVLSKLGLRDTPDVKQEYKKHYKN